MAEPRAAEDVLDDGLGGRGALDELGERPGDAVELVDAAEASGGAVEVHAVTSGDEGEEHGEDGENGEQAMGGDDDRGDLLLRTIGTDEAGASLGLWYRSRSRPTAATSAPRPRAEAMGQ